jgi:branched-chain amino acid transport system permease protein
MLGYTGLISLGQGAFFGVGVYTVAILTVSYGMENFWLVAPAGILLALLVAALVGCVVTHLSSVSFLLVTFAIGELLYSVAWKWRSFTGGTDGMPGIPRPDIGLPLSMWNTNYFYYFVFLIFVICFLLIFRILDSPFGHVLVGIRENESRMKILGYKTWRYKYISFIIGGLFGGISGVLYAYLVGIAIPADLGVSTSAMVLLMVILGSAGTLLGPIIGTALLGFLEYVISSHTPEHWLMVLGVIFIIVARFFRGGFGKYLIGYWKKVESRYGSLKN